MACFLLFPLFSFLTLLLALHERKKSCDDEDEKNRTEVASSEEDGLRRDLKIVGTLTHALSHKREKTRDKVCWERRVSLVSSDKERKCREEAGRRRRIVEG